MENFDNILLIKGSKEVEKKKFLIFLIGSFFFSVLFSFLVGFNISDSINVKLICSFLILIFLLVVLGIISIFAFKLPIIFNKKKDLIYIYSDNGKLIFWNNKKGIPYKQIVSVEIKVNKYFFKHEKNGDEVGTITINLFKNSYVLNNCINPKKVKENIDSLLYKTI